MEDNTQHKPVGIPFAITTVIAIVFAYGLFFWGMQDIFGDAEQYVSLGQQIATAGLFNFAHEYRTYGYPLLVALVWWFVGHSPELLRLGVFNLHLFILISASLYAARVFQRFLKDWRFSFALYACIVLNPLLLIYTTVVLSDLLSSVLLLLSVLFSVQFPFQTKFAYLQSSAHQVRRRLPEINACLAALFASFSVIVRPSNISIIPVLVGLWFIRSIIFRERSAQLVALMLVGFGIPFIPQLVNNYRAYQVVQPLVISNSYSTYHLPRGMDLLKYGTIKIPGVLPQLYYYNPLMKSDAKSAFEFLQKYPFEYMLTLGLHAFSLFDYDYAFPYVVDVQPWYRWPISIVNYVFLFITSAGIMLWLHRWIKRRHLDRVTLIFLGPLIAAGAYVPIFLFGFIEARYSLPEYMLLVPFFLYGIHRFRGFWVNRLWSSVGITTFGMTLFVLGNVFLSDWVQAQAPSIALVAQKFPSADLIQQLPPDRMGERLRLEGYRLEPLTNVRGGDKLHLTLFWWCAPGRVEPRELQTELVDAKGHVWAIGVHDAGYRVCPTIENDWGDKFAGRFTFQLPLLMPPGNYHIFLKLYDQLTDQYVAVHSTSGELIGNRLRIASSSIAKNKSSFTASELPIENPYFVDMHEIRLLGHTGSPGAVGPGTSFEVGLYWRARAKPKGDYSVVIQVRDAAGHVILEESNRPAYGAYPTLEWEVGEVLKEWHVINLPDTLEAGRYTFVVLLRDEQRGQILGQTHLFEITVVR